MPFVEDETAVERRRAVRASRNRLRKLRRDPGVTEVEAAAGQAIWESDAVARILRDSTPLHPIQRYYAYWQARRCGWDVLRPWWRKSGRKNADGSDYLYPPEGCPVWLWWSNLTWRQRNDVADEHKPRVSVDAVTVGVNINNPLFDVLIEKKETCD